MSGRPTIKDVAEQAGVSIATVSRALNDKGDVNRTPRPVAGLLREGARGDLATAVSLLMRLLERQRFETLHVELAVRLVVPDSTAAPRG